MGRIDQWPSSLYVAPDPWINFTPTLTQSASSPAKTITYSRYMRVGRMITAQVQLGVTGTGTASNDVLVGLPVPAATEIDTPVGIGSIYNSSNFATYPAIAYINASMEIFLLDSTVAGISILGSAQFTEALASGDRVTYSVTYEAAS